MIFHNPEISTNLKNFHTQCLRVCTFFHICTGGTFTTYTVGWLGGWLEHRRVKLNSLKAENEVEVGVELGKNTTFLHIVRRCSTDSFIQTIDRSLKWTCTPPTTSSRFTYFGSKRTREDVPLI